MRVIWICEFKTNLSSTEQACLKKQTNKQVLWPEEVSFEQMYTNFHDMLSIKSQQLYHPTTHTTHPYQEATNPSNPVAL